MLLTSNQSSGDNGCLLFNKCGCTSHLSIILVVVSYSVLWCIFSLRTAWISARVFKLQSCRRSRTERKIYICNMWLFALKCWHGIYMCKENIGTCLGFETQSFRLLTCSTIACLVSGLGHWQSRLGTVICIKMLTALCNSELSLPLWNDEEDAEKKLLTNAVMSSVFGETSLDACFACNDILSVEW